LATALHIGLGIHAYSRSHFTTAMANWDKDHWPGLAATSGWTQVPRPSLGSSMTVTPPGPTYAAGFGALGDDEAIAFPGDRPHRHRPRFSWPMRDRGCFRHFGEPPFIYGNSNNWNQCRRTRLVWAFSLSAEPLRGPAR
jgi:hypothetical protein